MTAAQLEAWQAIQGTLADKEAKALGVIVTRGGATLREICDDTGMEMNEASARVSGLQARKLARDSGTKRLNPKSGRMITVWQFLAPGQIGLFPEAA